jgi:acyl carrier protein
MKNLDRVRAVVAEALYLDAEEVQAKSNLMKDLGAESIDFLDIMFRLEKEFGVKLPKGEIERRAKGELSDAEFAVEGRLTDKALARVRAMMPEIGADQIKTGLMVRDIPGLFTVETFARMVDQQLFGSVDDVSVHGAGATEKVVGSRM